MSGYNANFRNLATGDLSTFDGSADHDGEANVLFIPRSLDPFGELHCGDVVESSLNTTSARAFERSQDVVDNQRFYARYWNFVIDSPRTVTITVTSGQFTPFISFYRDRDHISQSQDG